MTLQTAQRKNLAALRLQLARLITDNEIASDRVLNGPAKAAFYEVNAGLVNRIRKLEAATGAVPSNMG